MSTDKIGFGDAVCEDEQMEYRDTVYVVVSPEQYQVAMELNNKVLNSDFPSYGDTISNFEGRIDNVFIPYNVIGKRSKKANFDLVIQLQLGTGTAFKHGWFRGVIPPLTAKYIEKLTGNSDDAKMLKKMANQAKASTLATMAAAKEKLTKAGVSVSNGKILKADAEKAILVLSNGPVNFVVEHPWDTSFMEQLAEALDHFGIAWAVDKTLEGSDGSGMFIGKPSDVEKAELLTSDFLNSDGEDYDQYSEDLGLIDVVVIENDWKHWEPKDDAEALKRVGLNMVCEEDGNNYLVTITRSHSVSGSNQNVVVIDTALKGLAGDAFDHKVYEIVQILKPVNVKVSGGSQGWFIVSDPAKAISLLAKEGIAAHKFTDADKY